jgi:LEA14-like dessication related protein
MQVDISRSNTVVGLVRIHNPSQFPLMVQSIDAEIGFRAARLSEQFPLQFEPESSQPVAFTLEADPNFLSPITEKRIELPVQLQLKIYSW